MCPGEAAKGDDTLRGTGRRPTLPRDRGVYVVVYHLTGEVVISGRGGKLVARVGPGYVAYVGSAGGPGGLRARLGRHLSGARRRWWHVDSISSSPSSTPVLAYYEVGRWGRDAEDGLASRLASLGLRPVGMVGATDSRMPHLFVVDDLDRLARELSSMGGTTVRLNEGKGSSV